MRTIRKRLIGLLLALVLTVGIGFTTIIDWFEDGSAVIYRCMTVNGVVVDATCVDVGTINVPW